MNEEWYVRASRPDQGIWKWPSRIYIPCPLRVKIEFTRIARASVMSQAELGLVIVTDALVNDEATRRVIEAYRQDGKQFDRNGEKR